MHGVGTALADVQQQVFAFAGGLERRQFVHLEIVRRGADACRQQRRTKCQRQRDHAATSNTTACAAMPSPRPVKPSFSEVVA
jgi:hypothetical protein